MNAQTKLSRMVREWAVFLHAKGNLVATAPAPGAAAPLDVISVGRRGQIRLWKVALTARDEKLFSKPELQTSAKLIELANRYDAKAYLVIRFDKPTPKVLTVPAELVLAENPIRADLGGMDWPPQ